MLDQKVVAGRKEQKTALSRDTTWAKIFECIRIQANSLHSALRNGWKCSCKVPHLAKLQLQERTTGEWSSRFIMAFVLPEIYHKTPIHQRKLLITVKQAASFEAQVSFRPQPNPIQESYLDKLRTNIELSAEGSHSGDLKYSANRSISVPTSSTFSLMKKSMKTPTSAIKSSISNDKSLLLGEKHHR